jgi:acetyl-CoA carboxylase/biotin carboxylase 1
VEVMKMYMSLRVSKAGTLTHVASEGVVLAPGDIIATLELLDPSQVKKVTLFEEPFPPMGLPRPRSTKPHHQLAELHKSISHMLQGYVSHRMSEQVADLLTLLTDSRVPLMEFRNVLSVCLKMPDACVTG